jgi:hypothetical protein
VKRVLLGAILLVVAAAAPAEAAQRCSYDSADDGLESSFPAVYKLTAAGTSCGIARQVAFEIRASWEDRQRLPARVRPTPRTIYRCSYKQRPTSGEDGTVYMRATCTRGKSRRVTMNLSS